MNLKQRKNVVFGLIFAALVFLIAGFAGVYSYFLEIREIGGNFMSVVITNLSAGAISAAILFIFAFIVTYFWNLIIHKNLLKATFEETILDRKYIKLYISLLSGVLFAAYGTTQVYKNFLTAVNAAAYGLTDPIFGADISYYMLTRPLLITLQSLLSLFFIILLIYSVGIYYLYLIKAKESFSYKALLEEKRVITHLCINIAVVFLIKAVGYKFKMEDLLFKGTERVGGGYTDFTIWLNFYKIIPYILLAVIIFGLIFLFKSKYKALILTILVYPLSFVIALVSSGIVQQLIVKPNEGAKESQYIKYNIDATRNAYNLSDTLELEYEVSDSLNADVLGENKEIIDNIRITDHTATLTAYNQLQGIRNYYQFFDADVVPYTENGIRKASFMAVRELSQSGELDSASYVNKKMKYTHGYGIVKSPVNTVTAEGQPDFLIKDIPLIYNNTNILVNQPRIYFGEAENDYFIVNTKQSELDFADSSTEYEYRYDGDAGIELTAFNRLVYAIKLGDLNLLTSTYITSDSRLILNNNILKRLEKVVPFISFDSDVHIAIDGEGNLKWIVDGYTYSRYYPYSQYSKEGFNYIRNSVKAVVDAYDGSAILYVIDKNDPIIKTYQKIYPDVFAENDLPEDLASQIKYPEWLFKIQAKIFTKYHVTNPSTFYAGSDIWAIAREKYGENSDIKDVEPYYNITTLGNEPPEFVIMIPYTLKNKDNNLVGWLGARTDNGNYGKFISYNFPIGKHVYGTLQVENKIDNDPDISKEFTLWSQGGSSVMRGNMLVIPIKNSILYVEPVYITSQNEASLPEVKRIIVAYRDNIVMGTSLDDAFIRLFGEIINNPEYPEDTITPSDSNSSFDAIKEEYKVLKESAASGNWEQFGKSLDKIESLLN